MNGSQQKGFGIHKLPKIWGKCITSDGTYNKTLFIILPNLTFFTFKSVFQICTSGISSTALIILRK